MSPVHEKLQTPCVCLECRLRQVITGTDDAAGMVNLDEALNALGEVTAEVLAHGSSKTAKRFAAFLVERRKAWVKHPRVMAQQTSETVN